MFVVVGGVCISSLEGAVSRIGANACGRLKSFDAHLHLAATTLHTCAHEWMWTGLSMFKFYSTVLKRLCRHLAIREMGLLITVTSQEPLRCPSRARKESSLRLQKSTSRAYMSCFPHAGHTEARAMRCLTVSLDNVPVLADEEFLCTHKCEYTYKKFSVLFVSYVFHLFTLLNINRRRGCSKTEPTCGGDQTDQSST